MLSSVPFLEMEAHPLKDVWEWGNPSLGHAKCTLIN
jgi:hypothetical protein